MSSSQWLTADLNQAVVEVRRELGEIREVRKCSGCECLFDVLSMVADDLAAIGTPEAHESETQVRAWLEARPEKMHGCLGCAVCLPAPPYNKFSELLKASQPEMAVALAPEESVCGCGDT